MIKELSDLIEISKFYGNKKDYVLGGGGNTSFKNNSHLYVKASGFSLANISEKGFAVLDRKKVRRILSKKYADNIAQREEEVKKDLLDSNVDQNNKLRPSVEATLHEIIEFPFVVHTHPYLTNALLCSRKANDITNELFGEDILFAPYIDPGYILSVTLQSYLAKFRREKGHEPRIIFLKNHGVFVGAESIGEVKEIYHGIEQKLLGKIHNTIQINELEYQGSVDNIIALLFRLLEGKREFTYRYHTLISHFTKDRISIERIDKPFIPDNIVYCKANPMVIPVEKDLSISPAAIENSYRTYRQQHGYDPIIIIVEKGPVIAAGNSRETARLAMDVFEDSMKISFYSNYFGGPNFLTEEEIEFIENWEAESYRRKVSSG